MFSLPRGREGDEGRYSMMFACQSNESVGLISSTSLLIKKLRARKGRAGWPCKRQLYCSAAAVESWHDCKSYSIL